MSHTVCNLHSAVHSSSLAYSCLALQDDAPQRQEHSHELLPSSAPVQAGIPGGSANMLLAEWRAWLDTLCSMNSLAGQLGAAGQHAKAADLQQHLQRLQLQILGPHPPSTLSGLRSLANQLGAEGQHAEAADMHQRLQHLLDSLSSNTFNSVTSTAEQLGNTGQRAEAAEMHEVRLEHPDILSNLGAMAEVLQQMCLQQDQGKGAKMGCHLCLLLLRMCM